jgi:hypothetical protein
VHEKGNSNSTIPASVFFSTLKQVAGIVLLADELKIISAFYGINDKFEV